MRRAIVGVALLSLLVACAGSDDDTVDGVALNQMATLQEPISLSVRAVDPTSVFVGEKRGTIRRLRVSGEAATVDRKAVLDISDKVSTGNEQGLLGIVFSRDGSNLYVDYTNIDGDIRVVEYPYANGQANARAGRVLFGVAPPYPNHNGGDLAFGPDGYLYVGMGDGGHEGDVQGNAQNPASLLGKMVRIKADNHGAKPQIWAKGLRNPWRFSFDRMTGDLWIADVGQTSWEEVNHVSAKTKDVNYGWNQREATHPFKQGERPAGAVDPVYEYPHRNGNCAITGGYVYRGSEIRGLDGAFVFADYCGGRLMATTGGSARDLKVDVAKPISFGEDVDGELWVLSQSGAVYRLVRG